MIRADRRKYHYVYKITRTDGSGKYYIGLHSTDDLDDGYFGSGDRICKSLKKHGKEGHSKEILKFFGTRDEAKALEKLMVNEELLGDKLCLNLALGGGGFTSEESKLVQQRPEVKKKKSESTKRQWVENRDVMSEAISKTNIVRWQDDVHRAKMVEVARKSFLGKKHSVETIQKMKDLKDGHGIGEDNSQFGTCWIHSLTEKRSLKIDKNDLGSWLQKEWVKGRKLKF